MRRPHRACEMCGFARVYDSEDAGEAACPNCGHSIPGVWFEATDVAQPEPANRWSPDVQRHLRER